MIVLVQCLRVNDLKREWWVDLPELTSIRLGYDAFCFKDDESTELIMRSGDDEMNWWIDLPKLTSLTTDGLITFLNPRSVTLAGSAERPLLRIDMPSLHTVRLVQMFTFRKTNTIHTASLFLFSSSFPDITPALSVFCSPRHSGFNWRDESLFVFVTHKPSFSIGGIYTLLQLWVAHCLARSSTLPSVAIRGNVHGVAEDDSLQ